MNKLTKNGDRGQPHLIPFSKELNTKLINELNKLNTTAKYYFLSLLKILN